MATYKVLSDNFAGKEAGDTVSDSELDGLNVDALIEGGHLAKTTNQTKKSEEN